MIPIFYTPVENIESDSLIISGEEARHIHKVMRLGKGDAVNVIDGEGNCYKTEVERIYGGKIFGRIISRTRNFGEPSHYVTLAAGISTCSKFDDIIQKGVELGISRFIPLLTDKSKVKLDDAVRQKKRLKRWHKVAVASVKQSGRSQIPYIEEPQEFPRLFENEAASERILVFDPSGDKNLYNLTIDASINHLILVIGPESGFSPEEISLAREKGAAIVTLGRRILRAENAAPSICALVMHILGEFR
jgi:16S rRNA (uracil1498-N3)-methyltransferase